MKPLSIILLFYIFPLIANAQLSIRWNLGGLAHLQSPMVQFGVQKKWGKYGAGLQAGLGIPIAYNFSNMSGHTSGFTIRGDGRKYLKPHKKRRVVVNTFIGVETFYTKFTAAVSNYYVDSGRVNHYIDTALYHKRMWGIAFITGPHINITRHIFFESGFGVGFKIKDVTGMSQIKPGYRIYNFEDLIGGIMDAPGTHVQMSLPFNVSIGYTF